MEKLKIYIDRLKNGEKERLKEALPPSLIDVAESELHFEEPLEIECEVYIAEEHLVIHLNAKAVAILPCSICNEEVRQPILVKDLYIAKPLEEIRGAIFDLTEVIRESILLQTPQFAECGGKCPERENIKIYLKEKNPKSPTRLPFADLE